MTIKMFNVWYFFWIFFWVDVTLLLYLWLRKKNTKIQKIVLWSLLAFGFLLHFLKIYIPPYSVDYDRLLRDSWFVNICGANIGLFPILFFSKNKYVKDYMFYIGMISGLIALFYPQEPLAKSNQAGELLDILRFYYHHWMVLGVPLLMVLLKQHKLSWKRVWCAPTGLMILGLFIMLNQLFMSELGFIPLRDTDIIPNYKNSSYLWGPLNGDGSMDPIGGFLATFTPEFFTKIPVAWSESEFAVGETKYWPWFWLIFPVFILVTPMSLLISLIWDHKNFKEDMIRYKDILSYKWDCFVATIKNKPQPYTVDEPQKTNVDKKEASKTNKKKTK